MVLDTDWLATLGPILWDFGCHTMSFWRRGHCVRWLGVPGPGGPQLRASSIEDARELLDLLLAEFAEVFATPSGLSPQRSRDHHIHVLPGTAPVAVRPYRYPQLQKDELERQCCALEQQGLIRRSSSAFSALVLLVKKSDGTWRLCLMALWRLCDTGLSTNALSKTNYLFLLWRSFWMSCTAPSSSPSWIFARGTTKSGCTFPHP